MTTKTKTTKAPAKASKAPAKAKDLKPKKDAKGGVPAVQKVREAASRIDCG